MKGFRAIIFGIILLVAGIIILVPLIKVIASVIIFAIAVWLIWRGITTLKK
jgi:uncharacterized membrane protein HdeD (DUF308 family)